jgi:hypothetical protein
MLKFVSRFFRSSKNIVCETWDYKQMKDYLEKSNCEIYLDAYQSKRFEKFHFFGPDVIKTCSGELKNFTYKLGGLSRLEIQDDFNSNPLYYCRFVVAFYKKEVVGIIVCPFI